MNVNDVIRDLTEAVREYEADVLKIVVGMRFSPDLKERLTIKDSCVVNCRECRDAFELR